MNLFLIPKKSGDQLYIYADVLVNALPHATDADMAEAVEICLKESEFFPVPKTVISVIEQIWDQKSRNQPQIGHDFVKYTPSKQELADLKEKLANIGN